MEKCHFEGVFIFTNSSILLFYFIFYRGRSSDWYNKCYGHVCAQYLMKIRNSFQRMTEGPESKV